MRARVEKVDVLGLNKSVDVTLKHCPTESMLVDHFTKPLQGSVFQKLWVEIQGIPGDMVDADVFWDWPYEYVVPSPQYCVMGSGIIMDPTLHVNSFKAEAGLTYVLTQFQSSQLMVPIYHITMNCWGEIWAIRSYAYSMKCPRNGWITVQDKNE